MGGLAHSKRHMAGFTLLEILVAFVLMALVVGSLIQLFSGALHSVALSEEYSSAIQVAESQLQTVGKAIPVKKGQVSGQAEGTRYHWSVTIKPADLLKNPDDFSLSIKPFQVTVQVTWDSAGKPREFNLTSLCFGEEK